MAKLLKCLSCGATYSTESPAGIAYFHVCPSELIDQHAVCDPKTGEILTPATFKATPNPRNENFRHNPDKPGEFVITAEGSGVTEV